MANNTGQKYGGRKVGTANKDTAEIRAKFQSLVESNLKQLKQDIENLESKDRIKVMLELAKFVLPTLKAIENTNFEKQIIEIDFTN